MSDQTTDAYYRARTRNMAVTIILVSVAPLLLVTSLILYEFRHSYREKVEAHLIELVQKHKQNIDNFLSQRLGDIRILAMTFGFEALSDETFLKQRLSVLQEVYGPVFVDLGIIDPTGVQHTYAGPFNLAGADYSQAEWFQKALQRDYFVSDVFLGLRNLPHFIVAVRKEWKGEPWLLRATVDFVAFNALVEKIRMGQTGFAFILNREGELQTKPYLDIVSNTGVILDLLKKEGRPGDRLRVTERDDATGKKNLYVASPLKDREWVLVYQQNAADAFSDLRHAQLLTLVIILIGGLGIGTTAVVISRRLFTRIAKADREKEMMNEQIVETGKLASVGELAAGIAHEINNPVAIMVEEAGWIEDLLGEEEFKQGENLEEFRRALKQIKNQGRRCKEITHKLLSFARKTDPTVQEVQINDVVEEMVALSAQRAKFSSVVINTTLDERLPSVSVSQSELQQVLLNLINNALDAMEKKGGRLDIITQMDGEFITVFVADTGPGIPRANLDRIFDPFFTTKPVGKGTGLGLSICYGIIKKMGGDITVRSIVNMGTTFRVQIPLPKQKEEKAATEARVQTEGAH